MSKQKRNSVVASNQDSGGPGPPLDVERFVGVLRTVCQRLETLEQGVNTLQALFQNNGKVNEWLSTTQFAREVDRSDFTVRQWCNERRLMADKTDNGREWRIHVSELRRYAKEGLLPRQD